MIVATYLKNQDLERLDLFFLFGHIKMKSFYSNSHEPYTYCSIFLFSLYCCPQHTQHVAPHSRPVQHLAHSSSSEQQHGQQLVQHLARAPQHGAHGPQQSESGQHEAQQAQQPHTKHRTMRMARMRRRKIVAIITSHSHQGKAAAPVRGTTGAAVTIMERRK